MTSFNLRRRQCMSWRTGFLPVFFNSRLLLTALLVMLLTLTGCSLKSCLNSNTIPVASQSQNDAATIARQQGEAVYQDAWRMILEEYVDPKFNGQDWYQWKTHYQGLIQDTDDAYVGIQTMVASLDDVYTRFLPPREMNEQTISIDSRLYGIGVQIAQKDGKLVVVSIFEDTPAAAASLMPKDLITKIDGHDTSGLTVEEAADQIRGPAGTTVELTLLRDKQILVKKIPRAEIKIKSVFTKELSNKKIGYIRLSSFISESELTEMVDAAKKMGDKQAIIFDLRGNYGGLLSNAVDIADMFLDKGDIVSIVDRNKQQRAYSAHPGTLIHQPLVVLMDGGSASASEIVAGALKDHKRATLIGTRTFGKGLVQKIVPLADGSGLNITISKYLTPNGTDINKRGIEPNIEVRYTHQDFFAEKDPQLDRAMAFLQQKYKL